MLKLRSSRLLNQALLSLFDQAWLSALNLAIGLILIRMVSKDSYGVYSQLFAAGLFAVSMLESIVSNPLVNVVSGKPPEDRASIIQNMGRYQGRVSTLMALVLGTVCAGVALALSLPDPWLLGGIFALFVKANAQREYARSLAFLDQRPQRVLRMDLWYGAGVLLGILALMWASRLRVEGVFAVFALASVAALPLAGESWPWRWEKRADYRETVRQAWRRGRLALPGAGLAWGVNYSYLYLVAAWLGAAASAELMASRLLLMPISLCVVAWARVARPRIGELVARRAQHELDKLFAWSVAMLLALSAVYVLVLWQLFPWLKVYALAGKYDSAEPLLLWWGIYFAVYTVRWVGTAALMGKDNYGFLLIQDIIAFCAVLAAMALLVPGLGLAGAIIALIIVETFNLLMIWGKALKLRKEEG